MLSVVFYINLKLEPSRTLKWKEYEKWLLIKFIQNLSQSKVKGSHF